MTDLPTEAEVASLRDSLTGTREVPSAKVCAEQLRRLLALVEAWAPIVAGVVDLDGVGPLDERQVKLLDEAYAEWRRWKGETT